MNLHFIKTHFIILLSQVILAPGQTGVENPKQPLAKNAGRFVDLEEVLRIRDDGKSAIFRAPQRLALGRDGSLYFIDFAEGARLYRFGPDGRLIFKTLKSGQGPGESQHASQFFFEGDRIRVQAWVPPKIMDFDFEGRYLSEIRVREDTHGLWFLAVADGKIYGIRDELFSSAAFPSAGMFSIPNSVYEISSDFGTWKKVYEFPVRMAVKRARSVRLDMIDAAVRGSTIYILHTAKYRITQLDLRTGRVERLIGRAYDRVKGETGPAGLDPDPEARGFEEVFSDPYVFDINEIHAVGDNLWVFTSTCKPGGNDQQVDVFDSAGRFIDSFFLRFPPGPRNHQVAKRKSLLTEDGFLFVPEQEEDGLVTIGKYKLRGYSRSEKGRLTDQEDKSRSDENE
ncbi:MAG: 6-bladed beta-propeller [Acidobacteriota bacterium]